jgi:hypothetical protein
MIALFLEKTKKKGRRSLVSPLTFDLLFHPRPSSSPTGHAAVMCIDLKEILANLLVGMR